MLNHRHWGTRSDRYEVPAGSPGRGADIPTITAPATPTPAPPSNLWKTGAGGAPGACRGGDLSESVAKALRGAIGREKKRGISTILLARSGAIGAFATDLDNLPPRPLREGRPRARLRP